MQKHLLHNFRKAIYVNNFTMSACPIEQSIRKKITEELDPEHLDVINESYMHNVPKGAETHFKVVVVSKKFSDLNRLARHRLINGILKDELEGGVHALSIIAETTEKWKASKKQVKHVFLLAMTTRTIFATSPGFCADCGSILPLVQETGNIKCYTCKREYPIEVFGTSKVEYSVIFNSVEATEKIEEERERDKRKETEGPVIERKCPKCGNDQMSYATLQLRSADEGQTVFFTCTKCKHKETENS